MPRANRATKGVPIEDPFAEQIAYLMDRCLKIGPWTFGLDGVLGLVPGLGDVLGGLISSLIIARAIKFNVPRATILRMVVNVGIDSVLGAVPVVGDLFDFAFKSNTKNLAIYKHALSGNRETHRDWLFIILVVLILLVIIAAPILIAIWLIGAMQK